MPLLGYTASQPAIQKVIHMKTRLFVPIILAVLVASCAPAPPLLNDDWLQDTSLIDADEACAAPCWRGITPGETAWLDALAQLEADETLGEIDVQNLDDGRQQVNFTYSPDGEFNDRLQCCTLIAEDGETVSHILLFMAPNFSIGDVIARYGEPTYAEGGPYSPDQTWVTLVFEDVPMLTYVYGETFEQSSLTASSTVFGALYMTSSEMDELLTVENLYEWEGFGMLAELFDGVYDLTAVPEAADE